MSEAKRKTLPAALREEIDSIHFANKRYWKDRVPSREARAEHQRREDRLQEIRRELSAPELTSRTKGIFVLP